MDVKQLYVLGEELFTKRTSLTSLWQEIAENFYPERADFTIKRSLGTEFADNLTTSYPVLARRDLGNAFSAMLRPTEKPWFHMAITDDDQLDNDARVWLERAEKIQRRSMYDRASQFIRATKEGDHDFATFGQCAISVEMNRYANGLLYRCWHLRDMAWCENEDGGLGAIFRKWKPKARDLVRLFGTGKVSEKVAEMVNGNRGQTELNCMHMVVEADMVDGDFKTPYVSIYYDCDHHHVIEKVGVFSQIYVIPRWQTVSGSQYGFSPATVAALPDARLLQSMMYTLLEAGEKHTNPPMIATQEAIRSDVAIYAGGITWVDSAYDEKLGEVLRPLTQDKSGMPLGMEMAANVQAMLAEAFYLNKLSPITQRDSGMSEYEVGQHIQQYIRNALPLFEPMELDYNGAICEETFSLLMRAGAFGSPLDMPRALRGADLQFKFESPLHDAMERQKGSQFLEAQQMLAAAAQLDPSALALVDGRTALREVLEGMRIPATWLHSEQEVEEAVAQAEAQAEAQQQLATLQQGAEAAKTMGEATQTLGVNRGGGA